MSNESSFRHIIVFLSKYLKGNYFKFFSFYVGWLVQSIITVITPIIFGTMIDEIIYYNNVKLFMSLGIIFILITIWGSILYYFIYEIYAKIMVTFTAEIKIDVFLHVLKSDSFYLNKEKTGKLMAYIQEYCDECMNFMVRNLIHNINGIIIIILTLIYIIKINWKIGLLLIIFIPLNTAISMYFGKKVRNYGKNRRESNEVFVSWMLEMLSGVRDLRLLGSERYVTTQFVRKQKEIYRENNNSIISSKISLTVVDGINLFIQMSTFLIMCFGAKEQEITVGNTIIVLSYLTILVRETKGVCTKYMDGQKRVSNIFAIADFLDKKKEDLSFGGKELQIEYGEIVFQNVDFSYQEGKNLIDNFCLRITGGEKVAIVGESGSGKTTIAYLLDGFYTPQNGYISIDNQNILDCSLESIRKNIGFVQQNVLIFDGTIKENILLGKPYATNEEIMKACESSGLKKLLSKLPNGLETVIGHEGMQLSGGEKQRIAIARILIKNPPILIFDEATSALDVETESMIHDSLKKLWDKKTVLIITHRQSSVMMCDRVVLTSKGKIIDICTPRQMLSNEKFISLFSISNE